MATRTQCSSVVLLVGGRINQLKYKIGSVETGITESTGYILSQEGFWVLLESVSRSIVNGKEQKFEVWEQN